MKEGLFERLKEYGKSDFYPFHMPGHKRNQVSGVLSDFFEMDITEIDGFDNLHEPKGIIRQAQDHAAKLYRSRETYFLVNGSTAGILSAVSAISAGAKKLIIARNCHKAVYHAAFLNHLELCYLYPEMIRDYDIAGVIVPEELERTIEELLWTERIGREQASGLIAGVVITSPTYDGISSDVAELARVAHRYRLPLIVDQAHGAHFGFHPGFSENAVSQGADLVIHSVHKTLPAPTQTALLHRNGNLADGERLRKYLRIYQSSSPSYLLMAGIDEAMYLVEKEGYERLERMLRWRKELVDALSVCRFIRICPNTEPGKLVISVKGSALTGQVLYDILRERYHLQMEMASGSYVLGILTMMDTQEGFHRLREALLEIDKELAESSKEQGSIRSLEQRHLGQRLEENLLSSFMLRPQKCMELWEAYNASSEQAEFDLAEGRIVAEFVNLYPPGIPLLVPGEILDNKSAEMIRIYQENGYTVQGICDHRIAVIK